MSMIDDQLPSAAAQAMLSSAGPDSQTLSVLAAGIAHELNQPLAAIAAYAEGAALLLRRNPAEAHHALAIIQAIAGQALRAGEVVQQLRGGNTPLPRSGTPLDPNAVLRTVLPLLKSLASQQAVRLTVELRTPSPLVYANAGNLQTLLILLFGSAMSTVAHLPVERRFVTLSTDDAGTTVEVCATEPLGTLFQVNLPRVDT